MNRTKGILLGAALLGALAVVLALTNSPPTPHYDEPLPPPSKGGDVGMTSELSSSHLLRHGDGLIHLDIGLMGQAKRTEKKRLPLNLALIIDRSGSMAGEKLLHARTAARNVVEKLRDGDRVSLITYGSDVTVLVPSTLIDEGSRQRILAAISGIVDRGGTFLSGGLEAGRQEVMRHLAANQVARVILISDGQANEGITSNAALTALARETAGRGVSVTTMGVGLGFNEDVMTAMAESGNGYYYFINNTSNMSSIFSKELEAMIATVAQRPQLQIELAPGVSLRKIYGYQYEQSGQRIVVRLPDVFSEQRRKVICQLHVAPASAGSVRQPVARVKLVYTDDAGKQTVVANAVSVRLTDDPALAVRNENKRVMTRVAQVEAAAGIDKAMRQYADGDVSGAQQTLKRYHRRTQRAARRLNSPALNSLSGRIARQEAEAQSAAPSSMAGRRLIKRSKANAYTLSK